MEIPVVEKKLILPDESFQAADAAAVRIAGSPEAATLFALQNPSFARHRIRVGAMMHRILSEAGISEAVIQLGVEMGVAHDDGKAGLELTNDTVLSLEEIEFIRRQHTKLGLAMTREEWHTFDDPLAIAIARFKHHDPLPPYEEFYRNRALRWGLVHLLMACDRADAYISREYAQKTGAGLESLDAVLDEWVINGRPCSIPEEALVGTRRIDIGAALFPLMSVEIRHNN